MSDEETPSQLPLFLQSYESIIREKIPAGWQEKPARKGGWIWYNDDRTRVRIDPADGTSFYESQSVDHVHVMNNGKIIGTEGKPVASGDTYEAYIPLTDYVLWRTWNER